MALGRILKLQRTTRKRFPITPKSLFETEKMSLKPQLIDPYNMIHCHRMTRFLAGLPNAKHAIL